MVDIKDLIGVVLESIDNSGYEIIFTAVDGRKWRLYHERDCCESVRVEDVIGELSDLVGSSVLIAEEVSSEGTPPVDPSDAEGSYTWTFYKFATIKGYVTIRFYGTSNGYYSESVSFELLSEADPVEEGNYGTEYLSESENPKRNRIACLYHADLDGWGSAYAVWKALKETRELLFIKVQYGQDVPIEELKAFGPEKIFIVDFSYPAPTLKIIQALITPDLTVIDHHKTALPELQKWLPESSVNPGAGSYFFDLDHSGAVLTWDLFNTEGDEAPPILLYVQDRDLWRFELENSKEINAFIATLPEEFEAWDDFYMPEAYSSGRAILAFQKNQIERRLKDVRMLECGPSNQSEDWYFGIKVVPLVDKDDVLLVPFVNASENISELGEAMCLAYPDAPFSVSYCDRADGKRSYSLRSRNGFDVSVVAKAFGGGGHPGASGFTLDAPDII